MTIAVIQPLCLLLVLKKTKRDFLRYIGYLNFTKDDIKHACSCKTTELSKVLRSCLTAIKHHLSFVKKVYERSGKNLFWSIKIPVRY